MRDDELLAIYGATRQLAEGMTVRDAELKQSTAALEATIAQVRQLPAHAGPADQQVHRRRHPGGRRGGLQAAPGESHRGADPVASMWRPTMRERRSEHLKEESPLSQTWTVFVLILALGFALGAFGTAYFFFAPASSRR